MGNLQFQASPILLVETRIEQKSGQSRCVSDSKSHSGCFVEREKIEVLNICFLIDSDAHTFIASIQLMELLVGLDMIRFDSVRFSPEIFGYLLSGAVGSKFNY